MNSNIISQFELLVQQTQSEEKVNRFKLSAHRKALAALKQIDFEITLTSNLKGIKGIGKSSIDKIQEILETGCCSAIKIKKGDNKIHELQQLQRITGIGPTKAKKLFLEQAYTLDKLLEMQSSKDPELSDILTHHQLLGLKYLFDIEKRIPHKEIEMIEAFLNYKISEKYGLKFIICGSYRRQTETSGDIDIIFYSDTIKTEKELQNSQEDYLPNIIKELKKCRFLIDDLTIKGNTKYMGLCRYSRAHPARRIDIRFVPENVLGSAMLYFTGCGDFNKNMRTFALKKGYTINEYGIYYLDTKKKIETHGEEDIFHTLGLEYVEPSDRKADYKFI